MEINSSSNRNNNHYNTSSSSFDVESTLAFDTLLGSLQPLQDLAKNWDIDISSCLEEYLQELHEINPEAVISGLKVNNNKNENGGAPLNFAQAALVVQNSSHVYSRKVDFLYKLVFKQLEDLAAQTGKHGPGSKNNNNNVNNNKRNKAVDADVDEFLNFDPNQDFLPLDDVLPTVDRAGNNNNKKNGIDLVDDDEDDQDADSDNNFHPRSKDRPRFSNISRTRLSLGSSLPGTTQVSSTLLDRTSAVNTNAAAQRALIGSLDSNSCLRLVNGGCDIGENGVLLIPGTSHLLPDDLVTRNERVRVEGSQNDNDWMTETENDGGNNFGAGFDDGLDDDHDEGPGFQLIDNSKNDPSPSTPIRKTVTFDPVILQHQRSKKDGRPDPWKMIDPHDADPIKPRPLRVGKTVALPPGLHDMPSACVAGSTSAKRRLRQRAKPLMPALLPIRSIATEAFQATMARKRSLADTLNLPIANESTSSSDVNRPFILPLKGLLFGNEFAYIAKATAKRKAAERRENRKQFLLRQTEAEEMEAAAIVEPDEYANNNYDDGDDDDDLGGYDDFGDGGENQIDEPSNGRVETNTGMISIDDAYRRTPDADDEFDHGSLTFEELCRAHIRKFSKGAEKYAVETQLTQRVDQWQNRLKPILEEEETRPEFDIHAYGASVIDSMEAKINRDISVGGNKDIQTEEKAKGHTVDFQHVTRNLPSFEVCRMFLASLSLCNSGNITFANTDARETPSSALQMKLLKNDIDRPINTYLAPSLLSSDDRMNVESS